MLGTILGAAIFILQIGNLFVIAGEFFPQLLFWVFMASDAGELVFLLAITSWFSGLIYMAVFYLVRHLVMRRRGNDGNSGK